MVAFQDAVGKKKPDITVAEYNQGGDMSLSQIAKTTGVAEDQLKEYNKWLKRGKVPTDKAYTVILPGKEPNKPTPKVVPIAAKNASPTYDYDDQESDRYPYIIQKSANATLVRANGLPAIKASKGDQISTLAQKGNISLASFIKYNELKRTHEAKPGQVYYLKRKKSKAKVYYHTAKPGETYWDIAQKYGIRLKNLLRKNRLNVPKKLAPGQVVWVRHIRPGHVPVAFKTLDMSTDEPKSSPPKDNPSTVEKDTEKEVQTPDNSSAENNTPAEKNGEGTGQESVTETKVPPANVVADNDTPTEKEEVIDQPDNQQAEQPLVGQTDEKPENNDTNEEIKHIVKPGETLYGISRFYAVSVANLLEWNGLTINNGLSVGQQLVVLVPKIKKDVSLSEKKGSMVQNKPLPLDDKPTGSNYYEVKSGDTMYKIARQHEITVKELMDWNDKKDFNLSPGERLKIKK